MGDLNTYYWLFRTGAPVPDVEDWMRGQDRDHPRIRELVAYERRNAERASGVLSTFGDSRSGG
jgi:hypothetical protein